MHNRKHLAVLAALCFSFSACQVDRIEIPEEELFTREFIKSFGIISSDQDWSVLKRASVKVSVPGSTDVRILAQIDGKTQLLAHYSGVSGSRELEFDCPKQTEYVLVKTPTNFERVPLGGEVVAGTSSRSIDGSDVVPGYSIGNGYFWDNKYVAAIQQKLPEGDSRNMVNAEIVSDFSFISTGKPFVFYPIYWQTTGNDVLGVYWYENGEMKTMDLFSNQIEALNENGEKVKYHNIYHRHTQGDNLVIESTVPAAGAVEQPVSGEITLRFNRMVKMLGVHQATISSGTLSGPVVSADGKTATYTYSGLGANSEVTFWVNGGSFEATDNAEGDIKTARNQTYSFKFSTKDTRAKWTDVTYASSGYDASAGLSGQVTMTFDSQVHQGNGMVALTDASGVALPISNVAVYDNKMTFKYSGASLDTSYTLIIPDGFIAGADGAAVNLDGFGKGGNNVMKTPGYKYGEGNNLPFNITLSGNQIKNESGSEIISSDILTGVIKYPAENGGKPVVPKVQQTGMSQVVFDLIGSDKTISFEYGIKNKANSKLTGVLDETAVSGGENSLIFIKPSQKVRLTIYYAGKNTSDSYPSLWDNVQGKPVVAYAESYKDIAGLENLTASYTVTADVEPNVEYVILPSGGNQMFLAGLSYQLPSDEVDYTSVIYHNSSNVTSVRSRAASQNDEGTDLGTNGTIPYPFGEGEEPGHGFYRTESTKKEAISSNGDDEVLTHRISFTLKEGVIFGFYLRNNNGADGITNHDGVTVPFTSYSMSSLNEEMPNSFFNSLSGSPDSKYFINGWGTPNEGGPDGTYHGKLKSEVPDNRKYSTASTYTVRINGQEMRYFSFEDWVDYDFNDIAFMVAPESTDTEIVDNEVDTKPYIYAVEDLGATATSDIDFNDIVFAVEHVSGSDAAFVTMLAAGGTLKAHLYYKGHEIGNGFGEIVAGPHVGTDKVLGHVNDWFGVDTHNVTVNVGSGGVQTGFGALTTVRIPVEEDFSLVGKLEEDISRENGFFVEVEREDGRTTQITRPDHRGEAPQMIILPGTWHWPLERVAISEAYPGGINYDGTYLPSFQEWVTNGDGNGFQKTDWYKTAKDGAVMRHAWNGSEAARDYYSKQNN